MSDRLLLHATELSLVHPATAARCDCGRRRVRSEAAIRLKS